MLVDIAALDPLSPQEAADAGRLLELAEDLEVDPTDLFDAVHEAASHYASRACNDSGAVDDDEAADELYDEAGRQAADLNNGGLPSQVRYLVAHYGAERTEEFLREAAAVP
ncbi:hypothetical protein [Streptomyces nigrescens]|uniref:hypothetical protein n=1 Tax=Streptomyces nigrescens TaxID=1920 RepID=UPI00370001F5